MTGSSRPARRPGRPGRRGRRGLDRGRGLLRVLRRGRPAGLRVDQPGPGAPVLSRAPRRRSAPASSPSTCPGRSAWPIRPPAPGCWPRSWSSARVINWPPTPDATSELYYCLRGAGPQRLRAVVAVGPGDRSARMAWGPGDFLTLPAGCTTVHPADSGPTRPTCPALPGHRRPAPRLSGRDAPPRAASSPPGSTAAPPGPGWPKWSATRTSLGRSRVSVLLGNTATPQTLTVTHTLWAMLGVLPAGRVQRPHRHQSVALDLITDVRAGLLLPDRVAGWTPTGAIVDPEPGGLGAGRGLRHPTGPVAQPSQRVGPSGLPGPRPGCRPAHLSPLPRHPLRSAGPLTAVPFASALSEHPVATQATGEVAGAVLGVHRRASRPGVVTATRAHAGALEDIVRTVGVRAPSAGHARDARPSRWSGPAGRSKRPRPSACGPAGSVPWPRCALQRHPAGRRLVALRRLARRTRLRALGPGAGGRPVHLPGRRIPALARGGRTRASRSSAGTPRAAAVPAGPGWWSVTTVVTVGAVGVLVGARGRRRAAGVPGVPGLRRRRSPSPARTGT